MFPVTYLSSLIREVMLVVNINFITLFSFMEDGCLMNCSLPSFISNWIWFNLWKAWVIFSLSWIGLKMWQLRVCKLIENNIICYFSFISFLTLTSEFISVFVKIFSFYHEEFNQFHNWCQFCIFPYFFMENSKLESFCFENNNSNLVDSASSIRLSQRLSHACLSINKSILWNCEWLIISVIVYLMVFATWITVVILELIHA